MSWFKVDWVASGHLEESKTSEIELESMLNCLRKFTSKEKHWAQIDFLMQKIQQTKLINKGKMFH